MLFISGGSGNGNVIHGSKLAIRQGGINQTSHTDYELVGSRASQDNNREFDNPLYSDTGPVSTTETHTYYESVSCVHTLVDMAGSCTQRILIVYYTIFLCIFSLLVKLVFLPRPKRAYQLRADIVFPLS